jgi:hypothetical protein
MSLSFTDKTFKFPPVGRCIYCGDVSSPELLTDEHILPYALGGNAVLPKSSCLKCNKVTQAFEQFCLRGMFRRVRTHLDIQTRRPKERPTQVDLGLHYKGTHQRKTVPVRQDPSCIITLMGFKERPSILSDNPDAENGQVLYYRVLHSLPETLRRAASIGYDGGTIGFDVSLLVAIMPYYQMLAKIAHSTAVARFERDAFDPLLPAFILRPTKEHLRLIGRGDPPKIYDPRPVHTLSFGTVATPNGTFLVAELALFPSLQAPNYKVVVGRV